MAKAGCVAANHKHAYSDNGREEICITCLENEIIRLKAYIERGVTLLRPLSKSGEVIEYCNRAMTATGTQSFKPWPPKVIG